MRFLPENSMFYLFILSVALLKKCNAFYPSVIKSTLPQKSIFSTKHNERLQMGIMDRITDFFDDREGDFVPIDSMDDRFGPPVVLLFGVPPGIDDEEIKDMVTDGAPIASSTDIGIRVKRINDTNSKDLSNLIWLNLSVKDALDGIMEEPSLSVDSSTSNVQVSSIRPVPKIPTESSVGKMSGADDEQNDTDWILPCPVIYCSGLSNSEMMETYHIIAQEVFEETGGTARAACAKVVPPALEKSIKRVIMEITGDHMDALGANK